MFDRPEWEKKNVLANSQSVTPRYPIGTDDRSATLESATESADSDKDLTDIAALGEGDNSY